MFVTPRAFNLKEGDKTEKSLMFDTDRIFHPGLADLASPVGSQEVMS